MAAIWPARDRRWRTSLVIERRLAATTPPDPGAQRGVAVVLNQIGDVLSAQKNPADGLARYQEALAVARRLAAADPASTLATSDLLYTLGRTGDALVATGDAAGALQDYRETLALAQAFAKAHPELAAKAPAMPMMRLAALPGSGVTDADVLAFLESLKSRGLLTPNDDILLASYRQKAAAAVPGAAQQAPREAGK